MSATDPSYRPTPELYNIRQVQDVLGVSRTTVYELFETGQLQRLKLGRRTVVRRAEIDRFVGSLSVTA